MPALVDTAIEVMGNAYPDVVKNRDFIVGVLDPRGGAVPPDAEAPASSILEDELAGLARASEPADHVPAARHVRLPARAHRGDRRRARRRRRPRGLRRRDGRAAPPRQARPQGRGRRRRAPGRYREIVEQFGATEFVGYRDDEADCARARRRARRRRHGRDLPRPHAVLRRERRPGRRHGHDLHRAGRAEVIDTTFAVPGLRRHVARIVDGEISVGQTADGDDRRRPARRRSAATTPARTCCTTRCARCSATTSSRPARWSGPTGCASTSATTPRSPTRRSPEIEEVANRETLANTPGARVRDDQGRGHGAGRDRVLRRQVRRHRPRPRGRQLGRAVRRHARPRHRRHRPDQDRRARARSVRTCGASRR